jgi:hypothetical protein
LANVRNTKAENITVAFIKNSVTEIPGMGARIASLYGCKVFNSKAMYTCSKEDSSPEIEIKVNYSGGTTVIQKIKVPCKAGEGAVSIPYCEVDKAINSSGEIRVSQGEKIIYTVKIAGYDLPADNVKVGS